MEVRILPDAEAVAAWTAASLARRIRAAVATRGSASIALSGGSTPGLMVADLAARNLPWDRVTVFQVDERVAPDGHPDRNAALLDLLPPQAHVAPMPVTASDLRAACRRYASRLPERFDVVHLGLGDDGHTASWPPGDAVIGSDRDVDLSGDYRGRVRMTLTTGPVNAARGRVVMVAGAAKQAAIAAWLGSSTDRDLPISRVRRTGQDLPISRVRRTGTIVVLDAAAAGGLPSAAR